MLINFLLIKKECLATKETDVNISKYQDDDNILILIKRAMYHRVTSPL